MKAARWLLTLACLLPGVAPVAVQAQSPIKIGFVAELSGPQAVLGQDQYDGFMLFVEKNGGKLGGVPVAVLKEDSQFKPEVALQVVQKLIEKEHVSIITGVTMSNIMAAIHKPVTDQKVFLIGSNAGPSVISAEACSSYLFMTSFQVDSLAEAYGAFANERGYKNVYLLAPNYQGGKDFFTGFKKTYKGKIADEVFTAVGQPDYSAELTQVAAAKPDAVLAFYPGAMGINFVRQYQQLGLAKSTPLLTQASIDITNLPALKDAAVGVLNNSPWGPDLDNAANRAFVEAFEGKYHRAPSMMAAHSYDAAQLIDAAIKKTNGNVEDKAAFMAALKSASFPSVKGSFKFANNNFPIQDLFIQEGVKDAKGRVTLKTVATPLKNYTDSYSVRCPLK